MEDGRYIKDGGWKIYKGWRLEGYIKDGGWKIYKGWRMEDI